MRPAHRRLVALETLGPRARLLRLGGHLDPTAAAEVCGLLYGRLELAAARRCTITDLVLDLCAVGEFAPGGLETLLPLRDRAAARCIAVHLTGCADRADRLPGHARDALREFGPFLTGDYLPPWLGQR